jgi:hypothetical protein
MYRQNQALSIMVDFGNAVPMVSHLLDKCLSMCHLVHQTLLASGKSEIFMGLDTFIVIFCRNVDDNTDEPSPGIMVDA